MLWLLPLLPLLAAGFVVATGLHERLTLAGVSALASVATMGLVVVAFAGNWDGTLVWSGALRLHAALTPLSAMVAALVPLVALPVLGYACVEEDALGLRRLIALLLAFVGAMELLVIADDLLTLLIGWELVGACSWALIGHRWRDMDNVASATYAFVMTRFGDLGLFVAAMTVFAATGSFAYADLQRLGGWQLQVAAAGLLLSAASKSGQLPFSPWLFRAMAGPTSVSALLHAATMVAAGAYLMARLQPVLERVAWFGATLIAIGLATALAGGVVALLQQHAKKLLAASTSAHFGLMFVAVGAGHPEVAVLHLVVHGFFKALLFLSAGIAGHRPAGFALSAMRLEPALPFIASASAVAALSLAGLPPLAGAWTKDEIVAVAARVDPWLAVGVVMAGGLSAAYAARFQLLAFGQGHGFGKERGPRSPRLVRACLVGLAAGTVVLSSLWFGGDRVFASLLLVSHFPDPTTWQFAGSLIAVVLGLSIGRALATRYPDLGKNPAIEPVADWYRLPALWQTAVIEPSLVVARALARFDDSVIDRVMTGWATSVNRRLSGLLARLDGSVVDRGVERTAAFCDRAGSVASRAGEWLVDGLPEGLARLAEVGGGDARSLQSGLSHHYYAIVALGVLLVFATLWLGT